MRKLSILIFVFFCLFGCESLESTRRFYQVTTQVPLAPKKKGEIVPILFEDYGRRAYKVIGVMNFESGSSSNFILDAVQFNARENGADAVILREWREEEKIYTSFAPEFYPIFHAYGGCDNGVGFSSLMFWPSTYQEVVITTKVRAEMIHFLDKDSFGVLGLIFEDVRNAPFLEIGKIIPHTSAAFSGLKPGDKVFAIGSYICNQGLPDYLIHGPLFKVGEEVEVVYEGDGVKKSVFLEVGVLPVQETM